MSSFRVILERLQNNGSTNIMITIDLLDIAQFVGQEIGVSDWLTIDQDRVDRFADITGDHQWIHVDVERASREINGTIAHGLLILSLAPQLQMTILQIDGVGRGLNYGLNKVRFTGVTPVGSRIRLREKVSSVEPRGRGILVTFNLFFELEDSDRPVCVAEALCLFFSA
jgi:acyl dehydratase